jgi:hypothetical protein
MIFNELTNNNEILITINLQVEDHIYKVFLFLIFFHIYLKIHCQDN